MPEGSLTADHSNVRVLSLVIVPSAGEARAGVPGGTVSIRKVHTADQPLKLFAASRALTFHE
ncbi:hypothetical protein ES703_19618 [subsurface metagenome]